MRPLRFLLSLATCVIAFFLLLYSEPMRASAEDGVQKTTSISSYLNWRSPSALFPPSAVITLTYDNSTWFLARPAAFGPLLPVKSLTGQLWIGSGFGEDRLGRSGAAEGELGCSDVPGWSDAAYQGGKSLHEAKSAWAGQHSDATQNRRRGVSEDEEESTSRHTYEDDGTDDYLHHPLPASDALKVMTNAAAKSMHADIQSLQESAEITGKIVLLSRGGCGFLEKTKWAQRRGAIALIVGDDVREASLVAMYARGDTSNVTIPSLFVSRITAHLLSGLIPSGSNFAALTPEDMARLGAAFGARLDSSAIDDEEGLAADKPTFTTSTPVSKETAIRKDRGLTSSGGSTQSDDEAGWLASLFSKKAGTLHEADSRRPPTSGHMGWVLQQEFDDDQASLGQADDQSTSSSHPSAQSSNIPDEGSVDAFVIGVHDWRDPDLLVAHKEQLLAPSSTASERAQSTGAAFSAILKGGSIIPGSGEYTKGLHDAVDIPSAGTTKQRDPVNPLQDDPQGVSAGWFGRLFHSDDKHISVAAFRKYEGKWVAASFKSAHYERKPSAESDVHGGLWVTLTPTPMSSSPFFDTLLVLVVSPLVTLTIVYALLLLRSRIRRRRWRAPKSVVERLPVRTYQTMPTTAPSSSTTSAASTPITVTTPLLPSNSRPINTHASRPRSRTTSEVPVQQNSSLQSESSVAAPSLDQIEEKRAAGLAEWRRRYGGKQRECVVCLEEYVDGVSRVMSLPCGHEFHAECITPWLTTRRRTCPICKGDVVRSLARSNGSTTAAPPEGPYSGEDGPDEVQEQAAIARNDDPTAARPVSREEEAFEDLERGFEPDRSG